MCIIAYKEKGIDMPSDEIIRNMFENNSDGAGYAVQGWFYKKGKVSYQVKYHKGFMKVEDLLDSLHKWKNLKEYTVAIHCRITTHGKTDAQTTHPFLLSEKFETLRQTSGRGTVMFHNGTFAGLGGLLDENSSDTQDFAAFIGARNLKICPEKNSFEDGLVDAYLNYSRLLVLYENPEKPVYIKGQWTKENGVWYSNPSGYKKHHYSSFDYSQSYMSKYYEYDDYGANIAKFAWPSLASNWIRTTEEQYKHIMAAAVVVNNKEHTCEFKTLPGQVWHFDNEHHMVWTDKANVQVQAYLNNEAYALFEYEDDDLKDDYITFDTESEMLEFAERQDVQTIKGTFKFRYRGKVWYLNTDKWEAMTEKCIREVYTTGEYGHVIKYLEKYGTDVKPGTKGTIDVH